MPLQIHLDYPREFITQVSGLVDEVPYIEGNPVVIHSLKFETSSGKIYAYGAEINNPNSNANPFTFTVPGGQKIIGIFGRSGEYIDGIGFHVTDPTRVTRTP